MKKKLIFFLTVVAFCLCVSSALIACGGTKDTKLATPTNLSISDEILTWDNVENASLYIVDIDGVEYDVQENQFDLLEITNEVKTYKIKVYAWSDSGADYDSAWSEEIEYSVLEPKGLGVNLIENGTAYEIAAINKATLKGKIIIPEEIDGKPVIRLAVSAFSSCGKMTSIYIPDSVVEIDNGAFKDCSNLTRVRLPAQIENINPNLFINCEKLKRITIPTNVTQIHTSAFANCTALESVDLSEGLTQIENLAFLSCESLESITLPASLKTIGMQVFTGANLTSIQVKEGNSVYKSENNCLILRSDNSLVYGSATSIIPSYVTSIEDYAFAFNKKIESIFIPSSVTQIGDVFRGCNKLTSITVSEKNPVYKSETNCIIQKSDNMLVVGCVGSTIPDYIQVIGSNAFMGFALESIKLPSGLKSIKEYAFKNSKLSSIDFPDSLEELGTEAFSYCMALKHVDLRTEIQEWGSGAFAYSGITSINISAGIKTIGYCSFAYCTQLTSLVIPNGVTEIEDFAFGGCTGLTDIVIADSVTVYGEKFFLNVGL